VQTTTPRPLVTVTADGAGLVSHAGSRLLADLAAVTGLDAGFGEAGWVGASPGQAARCFLRRSANRRASATTVSVGLEHP
jgi:hypothetical protein